MTCARPKYGVVSNSDGYAFDKIEERAVYVSDVLQAQASLQRLRWPVVEPSEGNQDWSVYDEIYDQFTERNVDVVWLVTGTPIWVNSSSDEFLVPATHLTPDPVQPLLNENPFFEENVDGWTGVGGIIEQSDEQAHEGTFSIKLTSDGVGPGGTAKAETDQFQAREGQQFRAEGWLFSPDAESSVGIAINWFDKNGNYFKTSHQSTSILANTWTFFEADFIAPYRTQFATLFMRFGNNPPLGDILYGDELKVRRAPHQSSVDDINFQSFLEKWREFGRSLGERYPGSKWILWDRPNNPRFWRPERTTSTFVEGYTHYAVPWIKRALTSLGFTTSNFTNVVDTSMITQLGAYQSSIGHSPADGIMTSSTWDNLRADFSLTIDPPIKDELKEGTPATETSEAAPPETIKFGDTGGIVAWIQRQLIKFGYWVSPSHSVTGIWDVTTVNSWKNFERKARLRHSKPDGIAGPESYAAMIRVWKKKSTPAPKKPKFQIGGAFIDTTLTRQTYQTWYEHVRENICIGDPTAEVSLCTIEGMNVAPAPVEEAGGINGADFLHELYENASSPTTIDNFAVFPLSPDSGTYNEIVAEDNPFAWWRLEPGTFPGGDILYGMHADVHFFNGDDNRLAVQSDIQSKVQRSSLLWRKVQPTLNTFDWSGADAMVNNAEARGLRSNLMLLKAAQWANGSADDTVVPAFPSVAFDDFKAHYAEFCRLAAERYADKDILWEIWNEPNERFFWKDAATNLPNRAAFSELFEAGRAAIRSEIPDAKIAIGGITGINASLETDNGMEFLTKMFDIDGVTLGANDAVAVHSYTGGWGPDATWEPFDRNFLDYWLIRDVLDDRGMTTIPLWLNEWGWQNVSTEFMQTALEFIRDNTKTTGGHTWPGSATEHLIEVVTYFFDIDTVNFPGWGLYTDTLVRKAAGTTFRNFVVLQGQLDPGDDFSGNGHNGIAVGDVHQGIAAPTGAEGLGFGWEFNGTEASFRDGTLTTLGSSLDDGFTVEVWMSSDDTEPVGGSGIVVPSPRDSIVTIEDFIDDFEDQITDTVLWDHAGVSRNIGTGVLFIEMDGQMIIPQAGGAFRVVGSTKIMTFSDGEQVFWEWEFPKAPSFGGEQYFRITPGAAWPFGQGGPPDDIKMGRVSSNLNITINRNGSHFLFEEVPWDDEDHRFCRMRRAGGQIHFETSADGQTWVNPFGASGISNIPFSIDNSTIAFINGFFTGHGAGDMRIHGINVPDVIVPPNFGNAVFGTVNSGDSTALVMSLHRDKDNVPTENVHRLFISDSDGTSRAFSFTRNITDGALHHIVLQAVPDDNAARAIVDGDELFVDRVSAGTFNSTTDFDNDFVVAAVNNAGTVQDFSSCIVYDFILYDYLVSADRLDAHLAAVGRAEAIPPPGPLDTRSGQNNFRDFARAREVVRSFNRAEHMWAVFGWPDTITEATQAEYLTQAFEIIEGNRMHTYRDVFAPPPVNSGTIELREEQLLDIEYVFWLRGQDTAPDDFTPPPPDPQSYEDSVLEDNPFAFYHFNELSGTFAADSSGNNRHARYRNNPDLNVASVHAEVTPAVDFNDGFTVDEWVDIESNSFKQFGSQWLDGFTLEFFINTTSTRGHLTVAGCFNEGFNTAFQFSLNTDINGNERLNFHRMFLRDNDGGSASFEFFSSTIRDGQWRHVVIAARPRNAGDKFVWINGTPISLTAAAGAIDGPVSNFQYTMNIAASQDRSNTNSFLSGALDEVTFYTHVLSQDRVNAHFTAAVGTGETSSPPPPEAFDDRMSGSFGLAKVDYPTVTKTLKLAGDAFVRWIVGRFFKTPFLPPLVRPDPREGRYRLETRDRFTLEPVAVLPHVNIQSEFLLNRPNNLRFDLPLRHAKITQDNIDPVRHEVWMFRDGQHIYAGPIWSVQASSNDSKLSVVSRSLESYLETRHLGQGQPSDAAFTEKAQENIAWAWIEYTQRWPFGNWCFTQGTHTGVSVKRTVTHDPHQYKEILEAIEDLSELSQGFDWEISVTREFNTWFPRIRTDPIVVEYGANMSSYTVPLIGNFIANHVTVQGKSNDEDTPEFVAEDFASQRKYGRMEYVESLTEVEEAEDLPLLEARARYYLAENSVHRIMPSVVLRSHPQLGRVVELDDQRLRPGSSIRIRVDDGYIDINRTVRSTGYQLSVSGNDSETVVVYIDVVEGDQ